MRVLFANDAAAPWWLAGALGFVTVAFAVLRALDYYKRKKAEWDAKRQELDSGARAQVTEEQREARRDSATEAWEVVDRLDAELRTQAVKIADIEKRERECAEQRAADKMVLRMLVAWVRKQRNPPPIPQDILDRINSDTGSGPHPALPGGTGS